MLYPQVSISRDAIHSEPSSKDQMLERKESSDRHLYSYVVFLLYFVVNIMLQYLRTQPPMSIAGFRPTGRRSLAYYVTPMWANMFHQVGEDSAFQCISWRGSLETIEENGA